MPRTKNPNGNRRDQKAIRTEYGYKYDYDDDRHPHLAYVACAEHGLTNRELAKLFGVAESTIKSWIKNHELFGRAVRDGKDEFDLEKAENALFRRVTGFEVEETKVVDNAKNGRTVEVRRKTILPDVLACIFWLRNRNSERWKDVRNVKQDGHVKHDHEHSFKESNERLDLDKLSVEELENLHGILAKAENQISRKREYDPKDFEAITAGQDIGGEGSRGKRPRSLH